MRTKRLDKKIHKYWLNLDVIDLSQQSYWRNKLFNSTENQEFKINKSNLTELTEQLKSAIKKYDLKYKVSRVSPKEAEPWLSESGNIIFKFWPEKYPELKQFSGNNPDVI
jgi:hypothetical protein